ncbi:MAG: restriction endonuclease [Clostridiales bacterium]|nr:restriction endonuclease [Clostridiales bacterium]
MTVLFDFVVKELEKSKRPIYLESTITKYILEMENINQDSAEFDDKFIRYIRNVRTKIKSVNKRIVDEGWKYEAINFILNDESAIRKGSNFSLLQATTKQLHENPNMFADRIGYQLLKYYKCKNNDIHVTSNTSDGGIDFWGSYKIIHDGLELSEDILIVGQVKKYNHFVGVKEIREFIGAVNVAKESKYFGDELNINNTHILLFVTTGELSKCATQAAKSYKIKVISKRHLKKLRLI